MNYANTAWILTSTALVLFMTLPGLALFYAGLVKSKNSISVLAQCLVIAVLASVVWFVVGYSLSFSGDGLFIGNLDKMFLLPHNLPIGVSKNTRTVRSHAMISFGGNLLVGQGKMSRSDRQWL